MPHRKKQVPQEPEVGAQVKEIALSFWAEDRLPGLAQNTYTWLTDLKAGEREQARLDDYVHGFADAYAGSFTNMKHALDRYKHTQHGVIVDLAVYQLGYKRGEAASRE